MRYLLDTVVLSELRKARPNRGVVKWMRAQTSAALSVSVITLGEIERGIAKVRKSDVGFADELALWLDSLVLVYSDNLVPFLADHARLWGRLVHKHGHDGADVQIAASALCMELIVVTRNTDDFARLGVTVHDPFAS